MAGKLFLQITAGCVTLAIIAGVSAIIGSADDLSDYEKKQKELDRQAQEYQSLIEQTASDIAQQEEYKQALLNKISVLNEQIIAGQSEITTLDTEITELTIEIADSKNQISDRIDTLKQRLKVIYLSGETTSLEIILGAKTFEDFLDKLEIVSYISNSDRKMIDQLQNDIDLINKKKESLDKKKTQLSEEQNNMNDRKAEMQTLIEANQALLDDLYSSNAGAQDHLDETNKERQKIEDQIKAYYADKEAQERNAKLAKEAEEKLAASRKQAEESEKNSASSEAETSSMYIIRSSPDRIISSNTPAPTSSAVTSSKYEPQQPADNTTTSREEEVSSIATSSVYVPPEEPSSEPETEPEPEPSSSESDSQNILHYSGYVWPVPGHYTLSSVWNEDRNTYNHGAIDISDGSIMYAEVVAAESGTVVLSNDDCTHNYGKDGSCGCGGGYGNYLMIDHGDGKATLYAHLTSLTVSSGDYVQKGQVIGYVGSTGWSTGPHLHFETRLNGEKYNPMTEYPNM